MIAKVLCLFLIQNSYHSLNAFENRFCDNLHKDSLLALGGIFSIGDTLFATRRYPNSDQIIVWKFRLKMMGTKPNFKDNHFEIIDMSSHEMKSLFPGLMFDNFVSGFAITDTNLCNDESKQCINTSLINHLTVILGPKNYSNSRQPYAVYRFNGTAFSPINSKSHVLPLGLKDEGTTTHWFSPKTFITTTSRHKQKELIAFNYGDKTINKLDLKDSVGHKIGNRYWKILVSHISIHSYSYHLIELKVTETQRNLFLITQQMVYQLIDDKRLEEVLHPWNLFGCESVKTWSRIQSMETLGPKLNKSAKVDLEEYQYMTLILTFELLFANLLYISITAFISWLIYRY